MIITVTMNTAVDKAYVIEELKKGQVMRVKKCTNTPGGKGLNVARVIKCCGEESLATGFLGGHTGACIKDMLDAQQVQNDFSYTSSETRACINILESDGTSTELLEPGEPLGQEDVAGFISKFGKIIERCNVVTISGSVPEGVEIDIYEKLIGMAKARNKKVILDTSGMLLKEGIKAGPTMIKPNRDEIEALLGIRINGRDEVIEGAKKIQKMGIDLVAVSLGGDGALVVTKDAVFHGKPPKITTINTVGSGDSMVAAFAVGFERGYDITEMLRYAVAVSAANTLTMTTGNFQMEDMERIYREVAVERL
ncbi:1-phosphofructokinase [Anaerobium acetethylicum]|uniref:Tagatose-6-phosphate kinase n=1 Tax=Anaerobium acetethylicum TaxID=1619234 RepID=A0A1D3TYY6_9FIRM|nr:1-phosphofructokinase [Anaerobium acetethylicum]SCP99698.1 tagatose 6-phosphate kinase [Anaerobium acetethylicum]